jgi:ribose transport system ATP-binding protein
MDRVTQMEEIQAPAPADGLPAPKRDVLRLEGVTKAFPGVKALADVDLTCRAGEIHALVGENGSGKSTLVKVACGVMRADAGTITINERALTRASPLAARRLGLVAAFQDTALVPELSVADNILLSFTGDRGFGGPLRREYAAQLLEPFNLPIPPDALVAQLSPAMRQLLEVARAMMHKPEVLLLDEPTAALDADTIGLLQSLVLDAKRNGAAILYISHHLEEVQRLADRVTVLRDGVVRGTYDGGGWSVDEIVALMVGGSVDLTFPDRPGVPAEASEMLHTKGFRGPRFGPVDMTVRKGEIVGIAGAEGNGQRELVRALVGLLPSHGELQVEGRPTSITSPAAALRADISFQSGDRVAESIFTEMSVMSNSTLPAVDQLGELATIRRRREQGLFLPAARKLGIVAASPDQPIGSLSGGNQQKTVLSRAILHRTRLLIVDEPTQGVDARARTDIYHALREQADDGKAILLNSSDSMELAGLCDRVYVLSRGKIVDELAGEQLEESRIIRSFVAAKTDLSVHEDLAPAEAPRAVAQAGRILAKPWMPLVVLGLLMLVVGAYTASKSDVFLGKANLSGLFIIAVPLAIVAMGQQVALLTGGFDISVGAMMSVAVVLMSFWTTSGGLGSALPSLLVVIVVGMAAGLSNGVIVRGLKVNAIIATIGMTGILSGIALIKRPTPAGEISIDLQDALYKQVGFLPIVFVVVVVVAIGLQIALMRTGYGLRLRATGFSEEASHRTGVRVNLIKVGAFVACAAIAALAGIFLGAQTGNGDPTVGTNFALLSIAACVIGGASLAGGRGSFVGTVMAAVFLMLLINATPLVEINDAYSQLITGVLTILAVLAFSLSRWASGTRK